MPFGNRALVGGGGETGTVTWHVGDLLDQANEVAEITVTVLVRGNDDHQYGQRDG